MDKSNLLEKSTLSRKLINEISVSAYSSSEITQKLFLVFSVLFITSSVAGHFLRSWNPLLLAGILLGFLFIYLRYSSVYKETLLLISSLGVQFSSEYFTGRRVTTFIPYQAVQDIVIHEAVTMHKVVYFLAVLLRNQESGRYLNSLVPIFVHSMPRLDTLREIHSSIHKMLDFTKPRTETLPQDNLHQVDDSSPR